MAFGVVVVIVFSRLVEPGEFGVFAKAFALANIISALFYGWLQMSFLRKAVGGQGAAPLGIRLIVTSLFLPVIPVLFLVIALDFYGVLEFALLSGFSAVAYSSSIALSQYARGLNHPRLYGAISFLRFFGVIGFGALLTSLHQTAESLILSVALGGLVSLPPALFLAYKSVKSVGLQCNLERSPTLRELLGYGAPASISLLAVMIMIHGDRILADMWLSVDVVGAYSAQVDVTRQVVYPVIAALATSLVPVSLAKLRSDGDSLAIKHIERESGSLLAITAPLVFFAIFFPSLVISVLLPGIYAVQVDNAASLSAAGAWLMAWRLLKIDPVFHVLTQPRRIALVALIGLLFWVGSIGPLAEHFGPNGLAAAGVIAGAVSLLSGCLMIKRAAAEYTFLESGLFLRLALSLCAFFIANRFAGAGYIGTAEAAGLAVVVSYTTFIFVKRG
ncbi:MAG TPA: hypothetical protein DCL53_12205 [Thauera sp.]|nr:hypothetical protein [Thauera sp.]